MWKKNNISGQRDSGQSEYYNQIYINLHLASEKLGYYWFSL